MKKNNEDGFILMIVILLGIAVFVIGFAVFRIVEANKSADEVGTPDIKQSTYVTATNNLS